MDLKKSVSDRLGKDFSRHPHFRKQEYYFFRPDNKYVSNECKTASNKFHALAIVLSYMGQD